MSRHRIASKQPGTEVVVGWDNLMQTFFARVEHEPADKGDESTLLWLGACQREHLAPDSMVEPLRPYADLDPDMLTRLRADRAEAAERRPTKLQDDMLRLLASFREP